MLFHTLYVPGAGATSGQLGFADPGRAGRGGVPAGVARGCWTVTRSLRTGFVWDRAERPLQVVRALGSTLPLHREDWRGMEPAEQQARLAAYLKEDRSAGASTWRRRR